MAEKPFLTADWRHLLALNYEIDPAVLAVDVPPGTRLDLDHGRCYVSLVAFRFERTRVLGVPIPFHTTFPEVNLRFYVLRETEDGPRRGVVFLRELVNRRAVAWAANWAYNEKYRVVAIRGRLSLEGDQIAADGNVRYEWRGHGRPHHVAARRCGTWSELDPSSHEAFIAEHYFGYGVARDGRTIEYRVAHPPWRYAAVSDVEIDIDVEATYGCRFAAALSGPPYSAFVLDGSPVAVFRPTYFRPRRQAFRLASDELNCVAPPA
ncbi:MAG: DUF2071 domain-containing protein [Pirellulales bacterium]